ncbi:hypothetical protein [Lysinibacillus sp. RS5]|uniref:hypothetical protein n=1 Tax=Lysinibacillus sp. RS5 TaxID=3342411 RepID=UPI0035BE91C9
MKGDGKDTNPAGALTRQQTATMLKSDHDKRPAWLKKFSQAGLFYCTTPNEIPCKFNCIQNTLQSVKWCFDFTNFILNFDKHLMLNCT